MMIRIIHITVFILMIFVADSIKENSCITPYEESATCVPLFDCAVITSALTSLTNQAIQFARDSQCGCDMGMVCCGTFSNISYTPLTSCAPPPQDEKVILSRLSDESVCGIDAITYRIKGGRAARFEEFPWLAALEYESKYDNQSAGIRCGGSIINNRYILTAAHCIVDIEFVIIKAWLGVANITSNENCLNITGNVRCIKSIQKINIAEQIPHRLYTSLEGLNDIGLLRLATSIEFSDYVRPICLPSLDSPSPEIGTYLTVAGWGVTENGTLSPIKLKVDVPVQNDSICDEYLKKNYKNFNSRQLCVGGEKGKDSCQGDSGGPLMKDFTNANGDVQWYQAGIVSYGSGCGIQGRPAIYVKLSSYIDWIFERMNKLQVNLAKGDPCTTPNGKIGKCVPLNTCEAVYKTVFSKSRDDNYFARRSNCGYDNESLVCCESPGSVIVPNYNTTALPNRTTCGVLKEKRRIYGGETTDMGEFPWMAAIEYLSTYDNTTGIKCGGTLINSRYVLTLARCLKRSVYEPVSVLLGDWNTSTDPDCTEFVANIECAEAVQKIGIKKRIPHIFYNQKHFQNEIGLILLEKEIIFTDYISPICLPIPTLPSVELGTIMTIIGWGTTENYTASHILRKVRIPLVSNEKCINVAQSHNRTISSQQLCAGGEKGKDSCQGDSGGPLMRIYEDKQRGTMQWYQEGLTSYGLDCGIEGSPAVYTRITSYMDWIINIISEE